jgi:hypothetical protein
MKPEKLNEDCGCGGGSTPEARMRPVSKDQRNPNLGKIANLADGRKGLVDDSIRNSTGEIIGYVLTNEKGAFRVFKDKVEYFTESTGAMSSLGATVGMGPVTPPTPTSTGSGDQFPTIGGGKGPVKETPKQKKARKENRFTSNLMDFSSFLKTSKNFQQSDKTNKK